MSNLHIIRKYMKYYHELVMFFRKNYDYNDLLFRYTHLNPMISKKIEPHFVASSIHHQGGVHDFHGKIGNQVQICGKKYWVSWGYCNSFISSSLPSFSHVFILSVMYIRIVSRIT